MTKTTLSLLVAGLFASPALAQPAEFTGSLARLERQFKPGDRLVELQPGTRDSLTRQAARVATTGPAVGRRAGQMPANPPAVGCIDHAVEDEATGHRRLCRSGKTVRRGECCVNRLGLEGQSEVPLPDMDCCECRLAGQRTGGSDPLFIVGTADLSE